MSLKGRVAVVTGSGRGIGRSIAISLARSGAQVVVNVKKSLDEAEETLRSIKKTGSGCVLSRADVSTDAGARTLIEEAVSSFGGVHILVNNAGVGILRDIPAVSEELWDKQIDTNLKSAFLCTKYACSSMIEAGWGRIVNISSVAGVIGLASLAPYSAAKAGMIGLTRAVAAELSPKGVTANVIAAGLVDTKMGRSLVGAITGRGRVEKEKEEDANGDDNDSSAVWASKHTLTGRMLDADEIAGLTSFLVSDGAASITGQVFVMDAGWSMVEARNYLQLG